MNAKLIVVGGTTSTTEVKLRLPAVIGRGRSVQVTIPHSLVSRKHCEISEADGQLVVRDLDSMNGTYVGDERITEAILRPGALLTVGTVTFRAIYEVGTSDESQSDDSDDTCLGDDLPKNADFETVPAPTGSFVKTLLPPRLPDGSDADDDTADDDTATEAISDLADVSSRESAAKNTQ